MAIIDEIHKSISPNIISLFKDIMFDNNVTMLFKKQQNPILYYILTYKNYLLLKKFLKYCIQDTIAMNDEIQRSISPNTIPLFKDIIFDNNIIDIATI